MGEDAGGRFASMVLFVATHCTRMCQRSDLACDTQAGIADDRRKSMTSHLCSAVRGRSQQQLCGDLHQTSGSIRW